MRNSPASDPSNSSYDVVVAGGGMVGSLLAAALAGRPDLKVCVLEAEPPEPFAAGSDPDYDIRVSALSIASQRMFEHVDAWRGIAERRACAFDEMLVWDVDRGRTRFDAADIGAEALGHIVENRVIQLALLERLERAPNVTLRCPAVLESFRETQGHRDGYRGGTTGGIDVRLASGEILQTALLVGADGAPSTVRRLAGIESDRSPYDQRALVATIDTALPQQHITWQRFTPTGPQAFLPLVGQRASMVWYHSDDEIERLSALDDAAFIEAMEAAFPPELGRVIRVRQRASFPIAKSHAKTYLGRRVALIGDAAHTVHPLAGQGVNLGMLDAGALAETLIEASVAGRDIGSHAVLRRYERWRRGDNALMIAALDALHHAFGPRPAPLRLVRGVAMDLANRASPAKRLVTRYAMGLAGDLPAIAR